MTVLSTSTSSTLALLRLSEVIARTGIRRSALYRMVQAGTFPAPVKLGDRVSAWPEHEVCEWIAARIAARDARAVR